MRGVKSLHSLSQYPGTRLAQVHFVQWNCLSMSITPVDGPRGDPFVTGIVTLQSFLHSRLVTRPLILLLMPYPPYPLPCLLIFLSLLSSSSPSRSSCFRLRAFLYPYPLLLLSLPSFLTHLSSLRHLASSPTSLKPIRPGR